MSHSPAKRLSMKAQAEDAAASLGGLGPRLKKLVDAVKSAFKKLMPGEEKEKA